MPNGTRSAFGESVRFGGWAILATAAAFAFALLVGAMAVFGFGWFQRGTADFRGETEAVEQTKGDGNFRIAAYQQFFDLCGDVQAAEDRINIFEQRLEAERGTPRETEARTNLDAVMARRADLIREYNSKATRDFTEGQFRDSDLPYELDIDNKETRCAA